MMEGGIKLKWRLVQAGQTPERADRVVLKTRTGLGIALFGLGAALGIGCKHPLPGALLAVSSQVAFTAGLGKPNQPV